MNNTKELTLETIKCNKPNETFSHSETPSFEKNNRPELDEFKENLIIAAGSWYELENVIEVTPLIRTLYPQAQVICSATPEIIGNKDIRKIIYPHELEDVDVGIIRAEFGVAENGMVWITEKNMRISSLGLLSQHLIILLNPDQIVKDMHEAYQEVYQGDNNYGCFMLGPSATADIGMTMMQGARTLTVCFC